MYSRVIQINVNFPRQLLMQIFHTKFNLNPLVIKNVRHKHQNMHSIFTRCGEHIQKLWLDVKSSMQLITHFYLNGGVCNAVPFQNTMTIQTCKMYKICTTISPCTTGNIQYCSAALGMKQTHQKLSVVLCSRVLISNEDFPHTCCLSICILISHTLRCCVQWLSMDSTVHHCDVTLSLKYNRGYFHPL
jgi:hypothetical protein